MRKSDLERPQRKNIDSNSPKTDLFEASIVKMITKIEDSAAYFQFMAECKVAFTEADIKWDLRPFCEKNPDLYMTRIENSSGSKKQKARSHKYIVEGRGQALYQFFRNIVLQHQGVLTDQKRVAINRLVNQINDEVFVLLGAPQKFLPAIPFSEQQKYYAKEVCKCPVHNYDQLVSQISAPAEIKPLEEEDIQILQTRVINEFMEALKKNHIKPGQIEKATLLAFSGSVTRKNHEYFIVRNLFATRLPIIEEIANKVIAELGIDTTLREAAQIEYENAKNFQQEPTEFLPSINAYEDAAGHIQLLFSYTPEDIFPNLIEVIRSVRIFSCLFDAIYHDVQTKGH
jgi:hypothetical protein